MKQKTIFDLLTDITYNKVKWSDQSDVDKKKFQPYMIHRFLSMNPDYIDVIAECLPLISNLSSDLIYKFYLDLIPKRKTFNKYISSKSDGDRNVKLIEFIAAQNQLSCDEVEEYLKFNTKQDLIEYIEMFGYTKKEFGL